jgi:hypothetical protein
MPLARLSLLLIAFVLTACQMGSAEMQAQIDARNAAIAAEAPGDYYIGRRFHIDRTHFWGYLRKPRQPWDQAKLVVFNEHAMKQPDRLPESPSGTGNAFGFDHNSEYRIWGQFTGRRVYDPNSDLALQEFKLTKWQLTNSSPGWLFKPNEKFNGYQLFRAEPLAVP